MSEITQLTLPITGMTSANCVATIEANLKKLAGVETTVVNLYSELATVEYNPLQLGLTDLIAGVHRAGYGVAIGQVDLIIKRLDGALEAARLEEALTELEGVLNAKVSSTASKAQIEYVPTIISQVELRRAVRENGYETVELGGVLTTDLDLGEPMRGSLRLIKLGLSVSAVLAVSYVLVMLASLLMVGRFTTGSWQASFLGIGWHTLAGFEFGLLGIVILGFTTAGVFMTVYHAFRRQVTSQSKPSTRPGKSGRPFGQFWAFRLLAACLVIPALTLVIMRVSASVLSPDQEPGLAGTNVEGNGVKSQPVSLGSTINTAHREAEPSFTADGQMMYFNCNNADICVSYRIGAQGGGIWTSPERLSSPISSEYQEVEPVINGAGDKLYFNSNRPDGSLMDIPFLSPFMNVFGMVNIIYKSMTGDSLLNGLGLGHVWVSYRIEGVWSEPRRLEDVSGEPTVNSAFHDHCLSFSADGNEAFWTSVRPGGFGGNDIWTSRRVGGKWTAPENLGSNVNGPGDEHHSIPTPDGKSLYVTTTRQDGYGGEDIYITTRNTEGKWSPLVNLGPLVNGTGDDRCPAWTPDHKIFLFDSVRQAGFGGRDIWWVNFEDVIGYPHAAAHTDPAAPASVPQAPNEVVP